MGGQSRSLLTSTYFDGYYKKKVQVAQLLLVTLLSGTRIAVHITFRVE